MLPTLIPNPCKILENVGKSQEERITFDTPHPRSPLHTLDVCLLELSACAHTLSCVCLCMHTHVTPSCVCPCPPPAGSSATGSSLWSRALCCQDSPPPTRLCDAMGNPTAAQSPGKSQHGPPVTWTFGMRSSTASPPPPQELNMQRVFTQGHGACMYVHTVMYTIHAVTDTLMHIIVDTCVHLKYTSNYVHYVELHTRHLHTQLWIQRIHAVEYTGF